MALVIAVVLIALLSSSKIVHRALPSESILAFGAMGVALVFLFQSGRLG
ncbi:MAG TPA: hypothetical protein VFY90_14160 [Tepidiformaceae bacterium]|nr:hypothetical protein [Tepidiformaceae bacterium]